MSEKDLMTLCATLDPIMSESTYVYCLFKDFVLPGGLPAFCTVREREGLTVIVNTDDARRMGLPCTYEARLITLAVHSSLEAVGLLAVVSRRLADAGIPCNVVAGYHHDHILAPVQRADEAMRVLSDIARSAR